MCIRDSPYTNGRNPEDGHKVKGTIHWVSADHCVEADVALYDKLFTIENVSDIPEDKTYDDYLNPDSKRILTGCKLEQSMADVKPGERFQFVRLGYFCKDTKNENTYNQIVTLKDSWAKAKK